MKMPPEYIHAQENMTPGKITADGFLGNDMRPLVDIIEADEERLASLALTFEGIAERLEFLSEEGRKGLGDAITVEGKWLVQVNEARGFLPCPFEDGIFRKITTVVTYIRGNQRIMYSDLSLHLLKAHHFLEGKGSSFRLEPEELAKILGPKKL
ncbi:MAG TPA: hypothetical protein VMX75_03870 [Spirochaetia bacterium]|nr:hypothetical protein [Spirochaetia bacterium]